MFINVLLPFNSTPAFFAFSSKLNFANAIRPLLFFIEVVLFLAIAEPEKLPKTLKFAFERTTCV